MLRIKNVKKTFNPGTINEKIALDGINFHMSPGEFVRRKRSRKINDPERDRRSLANRQRRDNNRRTKRDRDSRIQTRQISRKSFPGSYGWDSGGYGDRGKSRSRI